MLWNGPVRRLEIDRLRQVIDRFARRRAGSAPAMVLRVVGERVLLLVLQVLHSRSVVGDLRKAYGGSGLAEDDRLPGIVDDDVARHRLLRDEFERAMLEPLVGNGGVVEQGEIGIGGPRFLQRRQDQREEGQPSGPSESRDDRRFPSALTADGRRTALVRRWP